MSICLKNQHLVKLHSWRKWVQEPFAHICTGVALIFLELQLFDEHEKWNTLMPVFYLEGQEERETDIICVFVTLSGSLMTTFSPSVTEIIKLNYTDLERVIYRLVLFYMFVVFNLTGDLSSLVTLAFCGSLWTSCSGPAYDHQPESPSAAAPVVSLPGQTSRCFWFTHRPLRHLRFYC